MEREWVMEVLHQFVIGYHNGRRGNEKQVAKVLDATDHYLCSGLGTSTKCDSLTVMLGTQNLSLGRSTGVQKSKIGSCLCSGRYQHIGPRLSMLAAILQATKLS